MSAGGFRDLPLEIRVWEESQGPAAVVHIFPQRSGMWLTFSTFSSTVLLGTSHSFSSFWTQTAQHNPADRTQALRVSQPLLGSYHEKQEWSPAGTAASMLYLVLPHASAHRSPCSSWSRILPRFAGRSPAVHFHVCNHWGRAVRRSRAAAVISIYLECSLLNQMPEST